MPKKSNKDFDLFEIDMNRLDEEWTNQPKLYFKYAEKLAEAKERAARREAQLEASNDHRKAVRAELDLKIRKKPKKYLGTDVKMTETAITNCILVHPKYKVAQELVYEAKENLIETNKKVSSGYSIVFMLDHRKCALERLVTLWGQNYFSTPVADNEIKQNFEKSAARRKKKKRKKS